MPDHVTSNSSFFKGTKPNTPARRKAHRLYARRKRLSLNKKIEAARAKKYYEAHRSSKCLTGLLQVAKQRAKKRGTVFNITRADILTKWPRDGCCPVLGIKLEHGRRGGPKDNSPSIDEIRHGAGYTPDNVAIISFRANRIKTNATSDEIAAVAQWLKQYEF